MVGHIVIVRADAQTKVAVDPIEVLQRVEQLGAPRLAEQWELDPCAPAPASAPPVPSPLAVTAPVADEVVLPSDLGDQEIIVDILARGAAFPAGAQVATERDVPAIAHDDFRAYYAAVFDATQGAIVLEHVGAVVLAPDDLTALGADPTATDWVLTRLHARSGAALAGMHLAAAPAPAFTARYTLRHAWLGPLTCEHPVRGQWGAPVETPALDLTNVTRGKVMLDGPAAVVPAGSAVATGPAAKAAAGCGCRTSDSGSLVMVLGALGVLSGGRRRRRRPRSRGTR